MANENTKMTADLSEKADQDTSILNEDVKKSLSDELISFLEKCRVEKGQVFTHTSFAKNFKGSFYISPDEEDAFYNLYKRCFDAKMVLGMIEKPRDTMPLLVDLDFKQTMSERKYDMNEVCNFVGCYTNILRKYVDMTDKTIYFYILEKPQPKKHSGGYKDGVHIVCPSVVVRPQIQHFIREEMLNEWDTFTFSINWNENFSNNKKDIYDEAVLGRNGWFMYGSHKATEEHPWKVSFTYKIRPDFGIAIKSKYDKVGEDLVELLSIRNKYCESELTTWGKARFDAFRQEEKARQSFVKRSMTTSDNTSKNINDNQFDEVKHLVRLLNADRANNYLSWMKVGFCLRNIDHRLLNEWIEFSRQSSKFIDGECDRLWDRFVSKEDGLKMGSLHMWAKEDNQEEYQQIQRNNRLDLIRKSVSGTEYDVACVYNNMFPHEIVYDSKFKKWWRFNGVYWERDNDAISIRKQIPIELTKEFKKAVSHFMAKANDKDTEQDEKDRYEEIGKKLAKVITNIKKTTMQNNIVSQLSLLYADSCFEERLNETRHLLGFDNGVYDLDEGVFRAGEPSDMISRTTGYNYSERRNDEARRKLLDFFYSIMPNKEMVECLLTAIAMGLHGEKMNHLIFILIGLGGNGKSVLITLVKLTFGRLFYALPIDVYTTKRKGAGSANPEIAKMKGARITVSTEPEEDDTIYVGQMKAFTGDDTLEARGLYEEPGEINCQATPFICTNPKPSLSSIDMGVRRRLVMIKFMYQFVDNPTQPHERPMNKELSREFKNNKELHIEFMRLLIEYWEIYKNNNFVFEKPKMVEDWTNQYFDENNKVMEYIDQNYVKDKDGVVLWDDFWTGYFAVNNRISKNKKHNSKSYVKDMLETMGYVVSKHKPRDAMRDKVCVYGLKGKSYNMLSGYDDYD